MDEFGKNATHAPDVDGLVVFLLCKDDLWSPVPPRHDVVTELTWLLREFIFSLIYLLADSLLERSIPRLILFHICCPIDFLEVFLSELSNLTVAIIFLGHGPGESEIANFDTTAGIDEEVTRFDVSMDNVGGVDEVQSTQGVVDYGHDVFFLQWHWRVGTHQLFHVTFN